MKLHSAEFEAGLKKAVRQSIRSSPEMSREYRRVKKYRKVFRTTGFSRPVISVLAGLIVGSVQKQTGHVQTALAAGEIYLLVVFCYRVLGLFGNLYNSPDLAALTVLPASLDTIFAWQIQKFFRGSLYVLLDLIAILGTLAVLNDLTPWKWAAVAGLIALTWLNLIGLAAYSVLRLPRQIFQYCAGILSLAAVILFFGRGALGPVAVRILDEYASGINLLLPVSWSMAPFSLLTGDQQWWLVLLLCPVAFIIGNLKTVLQALKNSLVYREFISEPAADLLPADVAANRQEKTTHLGITEIEEIIASGTFLTDSSYSLRHFPEQILWRWLNPRQRALANFSHPNGMAIGSVWKKIYIYLVVMLLLVPALSMVSPTLQLYVLGLGSFIILCMMLASLVNHGRTFRAMWGGGVRVPLYASLGIGYKELNAFFFKFSAVQLPFLAGALSILGGIWAWSLKSPIILGVVIGLKLAGLMFAGRFILTVFAFSSGTNDTSRFKLSAALLIPSVVAFSMLFLGLGAASLVTSQGVTSLFLLAGAMLDAWFFFFAYSLFYRFSRFDLTAHTRN